MILVLLKWGKDALSSKVEKNNCWSEQSPKQSTVPGFLGHPVLYNMEKEKYVWLPPYLWEHCGVVDRVLDLQSEGRGFESRSVRTPLDKAFCPQLSLSTQV